MSELDLDGIRARFDEAEDIDDPQTEGGGSDDGRDESLSDFERRKEAAALPLHDLGNAMRLVKYFGHDLLFVPRVGWFTWSGRVWRKDPDRLAVRAKSQRLSELIEKETPLVELQGWQLEAIAEIPALTHRLEELEAIEDATVDEVADKLKIEQKLVAARKQRSSLGDRRSEHKKFAKTTGNADRIKKAMDEAQVKLAAPLEALDAEALTVNVGNGKLEFTVERAEGMGPVASVERKPHQRGDLLTKIIAADYDPDAAAPGFFAFLERILPDPEMRSFVQRWFGLALTGLTGEQKLAFFYGIGANGKSVLVDLIASILGEYSATAKIESLTGQSKRGGGDATPDLVPLIGARMVRASEPEQGEKLKEGMIKELTGGEPIMVRSLHADFVEVKPHFKLTISGNHKPIIRGTDDGIWRRLLLVPFEVQIPEGERDPDLGKKLALEAPGILAWMVKGLLAYLEGGLQEPDQVLEATKEYRADSDPMGSFLTDCTVVTGHQTDFMESRDLIAAFQFWIERKDGAQWGPRTVSLRLREKQGKWRHPASNATFLAARRSTSGYRGIQLTDTFAAAMRDGSSASSGPSDANGGGSFGDEEIPI